MNLKDQIQQIKEFIVNFSIDINTDDGLALEIESSINQAHAGDSLSGILAIGIPYMGMLLPIIIVFIVIYFSAKEKRDKYNAMIEVSKNVKDPAAVEDETIELNEGEMYVVPAGKRHKPFAPEEAKIMLVEPKGVVNTGDEVNDLTAENDQWI